MNNYSEYRNYYMLDKQDNKGNLNTYYNVGKMLNEAGKYYGELIIKECDNFII